MNTNVKEGLLAAGGGALAVGLVGLSVKSGFWSAAPKPSEGPEGYEARILYTTGALFAIVGTVGLLSKQDEFRSASLATLGLAGAGLLSGLAVTLSKPSSGAVSQSSGAMMGVRAPAVVQMDAALHGKRPPNTTWINTNTGKRW
jgi:hypothetical protein